MSGWIKLHRSLMSHWCSEEPEALAVWVRLLMEANHSSIKKLFNGVLVEINRGQTVFGLEAFSRKSGVSIAKLRRYLDTFEKEGMINRQKTSKYSLITINYYDKYQSETGKAQANNNQIASKSQHYKNDKECKENKGGEKNGPVRVPYEDIQKIYNDKLPSLTGSRILCPKSKKNILAIWKQSEQHRNLDFWVMYFESLNLLTGRMPNWSGELDGKKHGKKHGNIELITRDKIFARNVNELIDQGIWK